MDCYSHGKPVSIQRLWVCLSVSVSYAAVFRLQRYKKILRYANYFCILREISMKLQKTYTKKIEKTATRVAVFNL